LENLSNGVILNSLKNTVKVKKTFQEDVTNVSANGDYDEIEAN